MKFNNIVNDGTREKLLLFIAAKYMWFSLTGSTMPTLVNFCSSLNISTLLLCAYTGLVKMGAHNSGPYTYYRCSNHYKVHKKERNINEYIIDAAMQDVLDSFNISDEQLKRIKKSIFEAVTELQAFEHNSIKELQQQYGKLTDTLANAVKQKITGDLDIDDETYNELKKKWSDEKREIGIKIAYLSESTKDTMTRMNVLADFTNRVPELYLKATLEEKRMILTTITERIIIDNDAETITVRLRPAFEHLRLEKQSYKADIKKLVGTQQMLIDRHFQACKNTRPNVNDIVEYVCNLTLSTRLN